MLNTIISDASLRLLPLINFAYAVDDKTKVDCPEPQFFGLVPWHHYLAVSSEGDGGCQILVDKTKGFLSPEGPIVLVTFAVIDDLLRIAGMVAIGFIIYGGIRYITSQGEPDSVANAQKTILNSVIGLVITIVSIAAVSFLGFALGGK